MAQNTKDLVSPGAKQKMQSMKFETASEVGVTLSQGYNGDITSRDAGKIGGNMVRKMIKYAQDNMPAGQM